MKKYSVGGASNGISGPRQAVVVHQKKDVGFQLYAGEQVE
jgi:hypothetical protein